MSSRCSARYRILSNMVSPGTSPMPPTTTLPTSPSACAPTTVRRLEKRTDAGSRRESGRVRRRARGRAGPSRLEPGDGNPERGTGDVIEADFVKEVDRLRVAAVFAADPEFEAGACGPPSFSTDPYQCADTITIDRLERRNAEDALLQIGREERGFHVVARETPGCLGEIVGAEGEKLGRFGNLVGCQGRPRKLDHRADEELQVHPRLGADVPRDLKDVLLDGLQFLNARDKRDHNLHPRPAAGHNALGGGLQDRSGLHL